MTTRQKIAVLKKVLQVIVALWLSFGFIFDLLVGFAFILTDGTSTDKSSIGNQLGEWTFALVKHFPEWSFIPFIPFMLSVWICAIPAGLAVVGIILGTALGIVYSAICTGRAIIMFPFTGKRDWSLTCHDCYLKNGGQI